MIKPICFLVLFITVSVLGQASLLARLKVVDPQPYFVRVVQETIFDVEENGWSTFKLDDFNQTLNEITHTNRHVTGEVNYFNGYLVSIQKIDVTDISTVIGSPIVDNVTVTTATVRGNLNLRNARVGYDVLTNLDNEDRQRRYTGIFTHSVIQGRFNIAKNMNTNQITISASVLNAAGGSGVRMVYMPTDEISEILSLRFAATSSMNSAGRWMRENIGRFMLDVATNKIPFPHLCFNC